jgi:hypothetical protein
MSNSPRLLLSLALAAFGLRAGATVPPPEKLLPKETVLVLTAPDWNKAKLFWGSVPYAKLWQDPSLKPFKDKFLDKFTNNVIKPLEQNLGIKLSDYDGLAQGQLTFALVQVTPKDKSDSPLAGILLMDAKDHAGQLKSSLAQAIKKWTDAGKSMKSQKIRETEFTTLIISPDDLSLRKIFPASNPPSRLTMPPPRIPPKTWSLPSANPIRFSWSRFNGSDRKVLSRQTGGMVPPLEDRRLFKPTSDRVCAGRLFISG